MFDERKYTMKVIKSEFQKEEQLLNIFSKYIERSIDIINSNNYEEYILIYGYILAKGLSYSKGIYSLFLDNLVIEAGALIRPAIEVLELLIYLQKYPDKIKDISNGKKPSAGIIAMAIDGSLKSLRDYLNEHSSHLDVSNDSMQFVLNNTTKKIEYHGTILSQALRENLAFVTMILYLLSYEAGKVLNKYGLWTKESFDLLRNLKEEFTILYNLEEKLKMSPEEKPVYGFKIND